MLTGELRNKIDGLWEMFWKGGIANPLDVVELLDHKPDDTICEINTGNLIQFSVV